MPQVYFSIGSNINRAQNVRFAKQALAEQFQTVSFSPVYQTKAEGFSGADFFNLVGYCQTELTIFQLREMFDRLEDQSGRVKNFRHFEDRTLDIDLLLYDQLIFTDQRMTLPHPDVLNYNFILLPLCKMNPDYVHPQTGLSLASHWTSRVPGEEFTQVKM